MLDHIHPPLPSQKIKIMLAIKKIMLYVKDHIVTFQNVHNLQQRFLHNFNSELSTFPIMILILYTLIYTPNCCFFFCANTFFIFKIHSLFKALIMVFCTQKKETKRYAELDAKKDNLMCMEMKLKLKKVMFLLVLKWEISV